MPKRGSPKYKRSQKRAKTELVATSPEDDADHEIDCSTASVLSSTSSQDPDTASSGSSDSEANSMPDSGLDRSSDESSDAGEFESESDNEQCDEDQHRITWSQAMIDELLSSGGAKRLEDTVMLLITVIRAGILEGGAEATLSRKNGSVAQSQKVLQIITQLKSSAPYKLASDVGALDEIAFGCLNTLRNILSGNGHQDEESDTSANEEDDDSDDVDHDSFNATPSKAGSPTDREFHSAREQESVTSGDESSLELMTRDDALSGSESSSEEDGSSPEKDGSVGTDSLVDASSIADSVVGTEDQLKIPESLSRSLWRSIDMLLRTNRASNSLIKALVVGLDVSLMQTIWCLKPKALKSLWSRMLDAIIVQMTSDMCPPCFLALYKTYHDPAMKARPSQLTELLKLPFLKLRSHFAVKRARLPLIEKAKYFALLFSVALHGLQTAGYEKQVYNACVLTFRELILATGQFTTSLSRLADGKKRQDRMAKVEKLRNVVISWSSILQCHIYISVMLLEEADSLEVSMVNMGEGLVAFLLGLLRDTATHITLLPFRAKLLGLCLSLMKATKLYAPLGYAICDFGSVVTSLLERKSLKKIAERQTKLLKAMNVEAALSLSKEHLVDPGVHTRLTKSFEDLFVDFLCVIAHHPAFPELSGVLVAAALKFDGLKEIVKPIIPSIKATQQQIEKIRSKINNLAALPETLYIIDDSDQYGRLNLVQYAKKRPVNDMISIAF